MLSLLLGTLSSALGWLIAGSWVLFRAALVAWATPAIYYSNLPWTGLRQGLAGAFAAFGLTIYLGGRKAVAGSGSDGADRQRVHH